MPRLIVTPGDPDGIGPELTCRALATVADDVQVTVCGDAAAVGRFGGVRFPVVEPPTSTRSGSPEDEPVEVRAIRWAVDRILAGEADALVTGPIHKGKLAGLGFAWPGHTGFLGHLCGVEEPVMAFTGGRVRVALATVHVPLSRVAEVLSSEGVARTIRVAHAALRSDLGIHSPRLRVCGLNPHAGDGGLLGDEETRIIGPAVAQCRAEGIDAVGPESAETAFVQALRGDGDLVVAMYHDQGLVPLKALDFGRTVNWTLGLPMIRTSVDHGTAYDLVGTGRADSSSMAAALELAVQLAQAR